MVSGILNNFKGWGLFKLNSKAAIEAYDTITVNNKFISRLSILCRPGIFAYRILNDLYFTNTDKKTYKLKVPVHFNGFSWLCDSLFSINADDTVYLYNLKMLQLLISSFLERQPIAALRTMKAPIGLARQDMEFTGLHQVRSGTIAWCLIKVLFRFIPYPKPILIFGWNK